MRIMIDQGMEKPAQVIWDYLHMNQPLEKVDIILVLGSHDFLVPEYAATLYTEEYAPWMIVSGGVAHNDDLIKTGWVKTESEMFRDVLVDRGVSEDKILIEKEATNTGDNFAFSKKVLDDAGVAFQSAIVVTKPYMERRAFATGVKQWPDKRIIVTSPPISFDEYFARYTDSAITPETVLNIMMGDLQRIDLYGQNGFQIPQEIPQEVWAAFDRLKALGFTKRLLGE